MKAVTYLKRPLFFIVFILFACQQEDDVFSTAPIELQKSLYKQRTISISEIPDIKDFMVARTYRGIFSTQNEAERHVSFDLDNIIEVIDTLNNRNYSLSFTLPDQSIGDFYNLIVNKDFLGNTTTPYVLKYKGDASHLDQYMENNYDFSFFKGSVELHKYTDYLKDADFSQTLEDNCPPDFDEYGDPIACEATPVNGGGGGNTSDGDSTGGPVDSDFGGSSDNDNVSFSVEHFWLCNWRSQNHVRPEDCNRTDKGGTWIMVITIRGASTAANPNGNGFSPSPNNCPECITSSDGGIGILPGGKTLIDCDTSKEDLKKIFPNASDADMQTLATAINDYGKDFGIDTKEKLRHFLAQAGHETGGFTTLQVSESTYWRTASKLAKIYKRFTMDSTVAANNSDRYYAPDYLRNSSAVANIGMCCRIGNGNVESGDGYKYRGRGIFQLTGKANYKDFKTWYNNKYDPDLDFVTNPDLISNSDKLAIMSGMWYYKNRVLTTITIDSTTTVSQVTIPINDQEEGIDDRKARFKKAQDSINCL